MSGSIGFTLGVDSQNTAQKISSENGYRIYILGDFSAHSHSESGSYKIRSIDMDDFDQVMSAFKPVLDIIPDVKLEVSAISFRE